MRARQVIGIVAIVTLVFAGAPTTPALADHCTKNADVERQRDGQVGGYHSIGCERKVYRIRLNFEGIYCNSDEKWECFDPEGPGTIVYDSWKECFNTNFCRGRRVMADEDVPASWYCATTWGLVEETERGDVERKKKRRKCEYMS